MCHLSVTAVLAGRVDPYGTGGLPDKRHWPRGATACERGGGHEDVTMEKFRRFGRWVGRTRFYQYQLMPWSTRADRLLYPLSGGRLLCTGPVLFPTLLLTTTGRRTGRQRTTPLFYVRDGPRLLLASSIRGAWAQNLLAHADITAQVGGRRSRYLAREATDSERARYWPRFVAFWPAYEDYAQRSGTSFVYVLEPWTPSSGGT